MPGSRRERRDQAEAGDSAVFRGAAGDVATVGVVLGAAIQATIRAAKRTKTTAIIMAVNPFSASTN
jgi:hypothetical protein